MINSYYRTITFVVFAILLREKGGATALSQTKHGKSVSNHDEIGLAVPRSRRDFLNSVASTTAAAIASTGVIATGSGAFVESAGASPSPLLANAAIQPKTKLPPIGLGCWAWGDSLFWGYNPSQDKDLNEVFDYVVKQTTSPTGGSSNMPSSVLLDTAELYGLGRSESLIGDFSKNVPTETQEKITIATKFAALPFRTKPENVVKAALGSQKRLDPNRPIDLYQIHFPNAFANEAYWDGLADAYHQGVVKNVGVSNYGVDALRACYNHLAKRGVPLASNQIQYSLIYRYPEQNGLLQACNDMNIQVLS